MSAELVVQTQQNHFPQQFTQEDIALIRDTVCKGASETEFKLFINQARTTGLNPLARQVFAVKRWDSSLGHEAMSIQVSIDGFRLIAERTGKYAGQTAPQWCGEDGVWKDVWLSDAPPAAARVGVLRHDFKEPCYGVARFNGYAQRKKDQSLTNMWAKMGDVMIAKCAESLALRKAFPQELSGLYTNDEMAQASPEENTPVQTAKETSVDLAGEAKIFAQEIELSDTEEKLSAVISRFAPLTEKLVVYLPKWNDKLLVLIEKQRASFETNPVMGG